MILSLSLNMFAMTALSASDLREVRVERARRGMAYIHCLYGTRYPDESIMGLPKRKKDRPQFLKTRMAGCADARSTSEAAMIESMAETNEILPDEEKTMIKSQLDSVDRQFVKAVLHAAQLQAETRAFQNCLEKNGTAKC